MFLTYNEFLNESYKSFLGKNNCYMWIVPFISDKMEKSDALFCTLFASKLDIGQFFDTYNLSTNDLEDNGENYGSIEFEAFIGFNLEHVGYKASDFCSCFIGGNYEYDIEIGDPGDYYTPPNPDNLNVNEVEIKEILFYTQDGDEYNSDEIIIKPDSGYTKRDIENLAQSIIEYKLDTRQTQHLTELPNNLVERIKALIDKPLLMKLSTLIIKGILPKEISSVFPKDTTSLKSRIKYGI